MRTSDAYEVRVLALDRKLREMEVQRLCHEVMGQGLDRAPEQVADRAEDLVAVAWEGTGQAPDPAASVYALHVAPNRYTV